MNTVNTNELHVAAVHACGDARFYQNIKVDQTATIDSLIVSGLSFAGSSNVMTLEKWNSLFA